MRRNLDRATAIAQLLRAFGATSEVPLGSGRDSDVFAIQDDHVLRLYRRSTDQRHLARLADFYARLDRSGAPFAVPEIHQFGERDGVAYAIETRVSGIDLANALSRMEGEARAQAIRSYVEAAAAVRVLKHPQAQFGEVIAVSPLRRETWPEFAVARAAHSLDEHRHLLVGLIERPDRAISTLAAKLASRAPALPSLVHGDYHLENVMVSADGRVCGVIDFGGLTLIGDADLDLAGAVLNLTGMAGVTAEDKAVALERAGGRGLTRQALDLYRLYYAFRLLGAPRDNDGLFRWCVRTISKASAS